MVFAGLWAPLIENFQGLFNYLQQVLSFVVPPVVCIFLLGLFWKKGTALAAKYTLICGHTLCIICLFLVNIGTIRIHFTIIAAILLAICILAYILLSLFANEAPKLNLENLVWSERTSLYTEPAIWYMQAKFIAALLVAITLIIVGIYW